MKTETVILLHGIFRTTRSMHVIEKALLKTGYAVFNIGYPSTKKPIDELAAIIFNQIRACAKITFHYNRNLLLCVDARFARHHIVH